MKVTQLSVFIENKAGRLAEVTSVLGRHNINIRGFSIADMAEFGIFRLIVPDPDAAKKVLEKEGFTVSESKVLVVEVPDRPGGLARVLSVFLESSLNVEYLYIMMQSLVVFSVEHIDRAIELLQKEGIRVLSAEEVYQT